MAERVEIGNAVLYRGDCREVLPTLPKVDCVLTDPPYGIGLKNHAPGRNKRSSMDWTIENDEAQVVGQWVIEWASSMGFPIFAFASPTKPWRGEWRQHLVWDKGEHVGWGGDPFVCWKPTWELLQVARNARLNGSRDGAVLRFRAVQSDYRMHPTPKPVALLKYLIAKATDPGALVLDPFTGSGSTGVACMNLGRRFIGVEIERRYFDVACERIDRAQRQGDMFGEPAAPPRAEQVALAIGAQP